jgi:hypothetical protein
MERIMKEALQYKPKNGETREDQKEMDWICQDWTGLFAYTLH